MAHRSSRSPGRDRRRRLPVGSRRPTRLDLAFAEMAGALDDLPDEISQGVHRARRAAVWGRVPATFSEPDLGPGRGDDGARAAADEVRRLVLEL